MANTLYLNRVHADGKKATHVDLVPRARERSARASRVGVKEEKACRYFEYEPQCAVACTARRPRVPLLNRSHVENNFKIWSLQHLYAASYGSTHVLMFASVCARATLLLELRAIPNGVPLI